MRVPIVALALVLAAASGHATWNYFAKGARNGLAFIFAFGSCASLAYLPFVAGILAWTRPSIGVEGAAFMLGSGLLNIAYYLLLGEAYRAGDLSLVYPLCRGSGALLAVAGGIVVFGERPTPVALLGAVLIVTGIAAMSAGPARASTEHTRAIVFALATGLCIATYTLWDKHGVSLVTPVVYGWGLEVARAMFLAPVTVATATGRSAVATAWREERRAVIAVGVLSPGVYMLVLAAFLIAPVSYVAPAREVSILIGALLGLRLLKEPHPGRRIAGASAIVAGVVALALG